MQLQFTQAFASPFPLQQSLLATPSSHRAHVCDWRKPAAHARRSPSCSLTGRDRRTLRSEAGRREAAGKLAYVRMPRAEDPVTAESPVVREVSDRLAREEIVRVKTAEKKKKLAAAVGEFLAEACEGEVAQVIGHTVLIYREAQKDATLSEGLARIKLEPGETA